MRGLIVVGFLLTVAIVSFTGCAPECMRQHNEVMLETNALHAVQLEEYEKELKRCASIRKAKARR